MSSEPKLLRCQTCGRLLTDEIICLGICMGHTVVYARKGSLLEWFLLKVGLWEKIALKKAKKEAKKYGY